MTKDQDKQIMKLLKVQDVIHPLCETTKGVLALKLTKDNDVFFILDNVPVNKDTNSQLMRIFKLNATK